MLSRRQFLGGTAAVALGGAFSRKTRDGFAADDSPTAPLTANVPVRVITEGPQHHWFGYYDKWEFDSANRYVLANAVTFEHRSPRATDQIQVGMVDIAQQDQWTPLGDSQAWGWQQGCMLQWVPGTASTVIWNDREANHFVSRLLDVSTRERRTLPHPIYTLSPDGTTALTTDFRRLNDVRPGYGYAGLPDPNARRDRPDDVGIWKMNLETGAAELLFTVAEVAAFGEQTPEMRNAKHWFNHLLFNTDGSRFIFLHRWRPQGQSRFFTRMLTASSQGEDLYVLDPSGETSHFIWRDPTHVCAWTKPAGQPTGFYLFTDQTGEVSAVGPGVMTVNGHNTYLPTGDGQTWILNDTYPDKSRHQTVYLYHVPTGKRIDLGRFPAPPLYTGEWRCDTHPRSSRDGLTVCIDAPVPGQGRQLHLLDIREIVNNPPT